MYSAPYYYYHRRPTGRGARRKKGLVLCLFIFILLGMGYILFKTVNVKTVAVKLPRYILDNNGERAINLMCSAMPLLYHSRALNHESPTQWTGILVREFFHVFRLDRQSPLALLENELPMPAARESPSVPAMKPQKDPYQPPPPSPVPETKQQFEAPVLTEDCLVAIYNTHTGETYALTDGMERLQGKRGGVVQVAAALEEVLEEKYGARVARSDVIHDDVYRYSYAKSKETLEKLLQENPKLVAVFDIHRDAGKSREESIVNIDGKIAAPILIIVGSDARAPFPGWENNYQFARKLAAEIDNKYPGLCLGVRVKDGRYNQYLHPRALLLEIGSVSNSTGEAVRSARLLGEVLGPVILELQEEVEGE